MNNNDEETEIQRLPELEFLEQIYTLLDNQVARSIVLYTLSVRINNLLIKEQEVAETAKEEPKEQNKQPGQNTE